MGNSPPERASGHHTAVNWRRLSPPWRWESPGGTTLTAPGYPSPEATIAGVCSRKRLSPPEWASVPRAINQRVVNQYNTTLIGSPSDAGVTIAVLEEEEGR